jgi:urate oxidase
MKIKLGIAVLISGIVLSCTNGSSTIFHDLGLIGAGLDYPYSQEQLSRCQEVEDERCLETYERVKSAKKRLFKRGRTEALQMTLNTISKECAGGEIPISCRGAIIALYFFSLSEDDTKIREFLALSPNQVFVKTYEVDNIWMSIRQDKTRWREWIMQAPQLTSKEKAAFLRNLDIEKHAGLTIEQL